VKLQTSPGRGGLGTVESAVFGLMGLIIALTYSGAKKWQFNQFSK